MIRKKSLLLLLVFTLVASMFLAACAPKEPTVVDGDDPTEPGIAYPGAERGNVLTVGGSAPNGEFNPLTYNSAYDNYINELVFDYLFQKEKDGSHTTEGGLVESYTVSEDGTVYTLTLRKGIKFHDGVDFTAEDVAFTYDVIARPDYKGRLFNNISIIAGAQARKDGTADSIEGIKVIDDHTLEVTLTNATAVTMRNLNTMVIPKHIYDKPTAEEMAALDRTPIGTGAFILKDYVVEQYVELEANPDYWQGAPKLDGIIYKVVARPNELSEFEIGSIDAVNFENTIENYEIIERYTHGELINNWNNGYAFASFNFNNPIFQDVKVRQALVYGLDRHGFVQSFFGGLGGEVAHAPISPVSWAYPSGLNEYKYNPDKANELLDEAGWVMESDGFRYKDGQKLAFTWTTYNEAVWATQITALAKENWKQIGVDCEIVLMDFNSLSALISDPANKDKWDMYNMAWSLTTDPDMQSTYSKNTFPPGNNRGYYYNEEIEELMEKGILELDQEKRKEIYRELAEKFNEDLPYIYVYVRKDPWLVNKRVKNFDPSEFVYWSDNAHLIEIVQ